MSTCAAKYITMGAGIEFFIFLKELIKSCWREVGSIIFCDNKTAILVMEDNVSRVRLKHVERRIHF
jgi:hypothetical protein